MNLNGANGIIVCGLNGGGKSTLGRALAEALGFHFVDSEDLYFPDAGAEYAYSAPRSRKEAAARFWEEIRVHEDFVLAAVKGDFSSRFRRAVIVEAPDDVRLRRIRDRSFQKFGDRMLPGGDLYEREEAFFARARARSKREVEEWAVSLKCPILRVDGTRTVGENVRLILEWMRDGEHV